MVDHNGTIMFAFILVPLLCSANTSENRDDPVRAQRLDERGEHDKTNSY